MSFCAFKLQPERTVFQMQGIQGICWGCAGRMCRCTSSFKCSQGTCALSCAMHAADGPPADAGLDVAVVVSVPPGVVHNAGCNEVRQRVVQRRICANTDSGFGFPLFSNDTASNVQSRQPFQPLHAATCLTCGRRRRLQTPQSRACDGSPTPGCLPAGSAAHVKNDHHSNLTAQRCCQRTRPSATPQQSTSTPPDAAAHIQIASPHACHTCRERSTHTLTTTHMPR